MIGLIRGKLLDKDPTMLLIDVNGVGYEVAVPMTTLYKLGNVGEEVTLYTHFVVREDAQQLYGFKSKLDKKVFQELIKVSGVGARTAIAILSGMECNTLLHCIENKDYGLLATIPGIGKKTAERLVIEIYDKMIKLSGEIYGSSPTAEGLTVATTSISVTEIHMQGNSIFSEAVDALLVLGYKQKEAEKMIRSSINESKSVEEAIRKALQGSIKSRK
ncbi:Holliday junction branch migration protein RuvA [Francisella frigiditurris]|uniref:Holliday junction branch migration complex subunit RuvA n=1 Tax=Francisella frigiditurris TaxID=1542390 RepID=A0A1J0KSZ9_9GAMM|nr:Holliday junction branch migration protein RuvA [Francisella frigiditurris]APC96893.1 Holliday junction DNA helicase RuvA [Francisella frigiditurris]